MIRLRRKAEMLAIGLFLTATCFCTNMYAQAKHYTSQNAHSHNDYNQKQPFFLAYNHHFGSVEADVYPRKGQLMVAHNSADIKPSRTLINLYLKPIINKYYHDKNWPDDGMQLLIDIKENPDSTLAILQRELNPYKEIFDKANNPRGIKIVMSGSRPSPEDYKDYPSYITFDYWLNKKLSSTELQRVGLVSMPFYKISSWKGSGEIPANDGEKLKAVTDTAHALHKKMRFWATPDTPASWKILMRAGVDYIGTDHIAALAKFINQKQKE